MRETYHFYAVNPSQNDSKSLLYFKSWSRHQKMTLLFTMVLTSSPGLPLGGGCLTDVLKEVVMMWYS